MAKMTLAIADNTVGASWECILPSNDSQELGTKEQLPETREQYPHPFSSASDETNGTSSEVCRPDPSVHTVCTP
eukprot:5346066-Amphidinium_carterae.1